MYIQLVKDFWRIIDEADFDKLSEVMCEDANVFLPNTREVFKGVVKYIEFNKEYPGRWYASIKKIMSATDTVISVVNIKSEDGISFYVTSFFNFENSKIKLITEYWGENSEAPQWRLEKQYSEKY